MRSSEIYFSGLRSRQQERPQLPPCFDDLLRRYVSADGVGWSRYLPLGTHTHSHVHAGKDRKDSPGAYLLHVLFAADSHLLDQREEASSSMRSMTSAPNPCCPQFALAESTIRRIQAPPSPAAYPPCSKIYDLTSCKSALARPDWRKPERESRA